MSTLATQPTELPLLPFIEGLKPNYRQKEAITLVDLFERLTGEKAVVWGDYFIIGFGTYSYSRKGSKDVYTWFKSGFAVRKNKVTLYLTTNLDLYEELLLDLGPHTRGKGCLYLKKLTDVRLDVLENLILKAYRIYEKSD